jgi:succinoglycan biosynthesis protein ExoO
MHVKYQEARPIVSVVMPVYNGAETVREAVDSVLMQSMHDLELVICNDASTDGTRSVLEGMDDDRVMVLHNAENIGEGLSRDRAIGAARGVWVAVIDADDSWDADRLSTLLRGADPEESTMIFDDILECHDTASGMIPWRNLRGRHAFGGNGRDAVPVSVADFVVSRRLLIKPLIPLMCLRRYGCHHSPRSFGADTEFFLELMASGMGMRYVPKALYNYRITPGSASGNARRAAMMREVLENALSRFSGYPDVQRALKRKMDAVARDEKYMPFIWSLREKKYVESFQMAMRSPWMIGEFLRRSVESVAYNLHRIWRGGRARGVR